MSVHAISRATSLLARILLMNQAVVVCALKTPVCVVIFTTSRQNWANQVQTLEMC